MQYKPISLTGFPFLEKYVHDIYEINNQESEFVYTTVPNGIIGISIVLSGECSVLKNGKWSKDHQVGIYGMIQRPQLIKIGPGFREIAIGFKPYVLKSMIKEPLSSMANGNSACSFDLFDTGLVNQLLDSLYSSQSDLDIKSCINRFVSSTLHPEKVNERIIYASNMILQGTVQVETIASEINTSSVTMRQLFKDNIGLSPKELIQLYRIKTALNLTEQAKISLTRLSYELGYFDQAHFIHHFKSTMGLSPKKYYENDLFTFDFYNFKRWRGDSFGLMNK